MEVCGLESTQLSFLPYMSVLRRDGRYSGKQLAYIGLLHGLSQGYLSQQFDPSLCSEEFLGIMKDEAQTALIETP